MFIFLHFILFLMTKELPSDGSLAHDTLKQSCCQDRGSVSVVCALIRYISEQSLLSCKIKDEKLINMTRFLHFLI